jgi:hypothetical protein
MKCEEITSLIRETPLRELPAALRSALGRHASNCPACERMLASERILQTAMSRLAEPKAPAQLAADIASRIAQLDSARDSAERSESRILATKRRRTKLGWAAMSLGALVCLTCALYGLSVGAWRFGSPTSTIADFAHMDELRRMGLVAYGLLFGALLYLQGIFTHSGSAPDNPRRRMTFPGFRM